MTDILLAMYNGEKYISGQLDSILGQTEQDIRIIIRDDRSSDGSADIAESYAEKYPDKVIFLRGEFSTGSAQGNFTELLRYAESEYIMFSDQDDVWLPDKIKITLSAMKELEKKAGDVPLLVHSDLEVTGAQLETLHPSMFKFQGLSGKYKTLGRLYSQNNVTGCTVMINRRLLELALKADPSDMLMHDWWFALIAAAFGEIGFIDRPLIKYRQHGNNQLGAVNNRNLKGIIRAVKKQREMRGKISRTYEQAAAFYRQYGDIMPENARKVTEYYLSIPNKCKPARITALISHGHLKQNFMAAVGQLIFC